MVQIHLLLFEMSIGWSSRIVEFNLNCFRLEFVFVGLKCRLHLSRLYYVLHVFFV